ncbi:MAG: plasmid replication protein, CyRepA1 family [Cyanobacteria bacterium P01_A01_bin.84]
MISNSTKNSNRASGFAPQQFSKSNPCPVCGDNSGACRYNAHDEDFIMCHTHADARKGDVINGYVCVSPAKGHTAGFKPYQNYSQLSETEKLQAIALQKKKKAERDADNKAKAEEKKQKALSIEDRNKYYSDLLNQLTINDVTRDDLKRRGFTDEEIDKSDFRSITKWQSIDGDYPTELPGMSNDGKKLVIYDDGYLCPIRDFDGNILAMQYRIQNPENGNRYKWLSTPKTATLQTKEENELPLPVFFPSGKPEAIAIVEGVGAKPYFVAQRLNCLTIGAAGGQWLSSEKLLRKYIQQAFSAYGELPIIVIPDAGFALNSQVCEKINDLIEFLQNNYGNDEFSNIYVLDWNQIHKNQGDIDEIDKSKMRPRQLKSTSFQSKYKEALASSKNYKRFQKWAENRKKLTTKDTPLEEYLKISNDIHQRTDIYFVRKSMGGGKTKAMLDWLKICGIPALIISYRNSLCKSNVTEAEKLGINALHIVDSHERLEGVNVNHMKDGNIQLLVGCIDSFEKMKGFIAANPEYVIIIDEVDSVLDHIKGGGTLNNRQRKAIEFFKDAVENAKFSLMMDANLNDDNVNFIKKVFPNKKYQIKDSLPKFKLTSKEIYFLESASEKNDYNRSPKNLGVNLLQIAQKACKDNEVLLVISDSQRTCADYERMAIKAGKKVFRFDSQTSNNKASKDFKDNPSKFIKDNQIEVLIISPSGESGLDISVYDYFDKVLFDIKGVLGVNKLIQMSGRLRDRKVPIYVACPEFVNMTENICPYGMKKIDEVINQRIEAKINLLSYVEGIEERNELIREIGMQWIEQAQNDMFFHCALEDAKRLKYEHSNLKLCLKTALQQDGNTCIDLVEAVEEEAKADKKEYTNFTKDRDSNDIFNSSDITSEKLEEMSKSKNHDWENQCKIAKAKLKYVYLPGIENTESWNKDIFRILNIEHKTLLSKLWRFEQFKNDELFKARFKLRNDLKLQYSDYPSIQFWKDDSRKIAIIKAMGFGEILAKGWFCTQDKDIVDFVNRYYEDDRLFNQLGISRTPKKGDNKYIKQTFDKFLDYFGLSCGKVKKKIKGVNYYKIRVCEKLAKNIEDLELNLNYETLVSNILSCFKTRTEKMIKDAADISLIKSIEVSKQQELDDKQWEELELQKQQLNHIWNAQENDEVLTTKERVIGISQMLDYVENQEQADDIKALYSSFVIQAAMSFLDTRKQEELSQFGFPVTTWGAYDRWFNSYVGTSNFSLENIEIGF